MRYLFLFFLILFNGCCYSQDPLYVTFDLNPEPDMYQYFLVYSDDISSPVYATADSFDIMWTYKTINHDSLKVIGPVADVLLGTFSMNGQHIQAAICAVDFSGNRSQIAASQLYHKRDDDPPGIPSGGSIAIYRK
jgi:hypothetical protein